MSQLKGSCHCGVVQYEVRSEVKKVVNCHCNFCRKMNGSAFSTYAAVLSSDFTLTKGELNQHAVTEQATKHFCGKCGTPIYNANPKYQGLNILHFGTLNNANSLVPDVNIYCESEVDWAKQLNAVPSLAKGVK